MNAVQVLRAMFHRGLCNKECHHYPWSPKAVVMAAAAFWFLPWLLYHPPLSWECQAGRAGKRFTSVPRRTRPWNHHGEVPSMLRHRGHLSPLGDAEGKSLPRATVGLTPLQDLDSSKLLQASESPTEEGAAHSGIHNLELVRSQSKSAPATEETASGSLSLLWVCK